LRSGAPVIYHRGQYGPTILESEIDREDVDQWLDVPLWSGEGQALGKISIDNKVTGQTRPDRPKGPRPIGNEHFDQLLAISGFAANAIQEEHRLDDTRHKLESIQKLRKIDAEITRELAVEPLQLSITRWAVELLEATGGSLSCCYPQRQEVAVGATYQLDELKGMVFAYGEGLLGKVAQTGRSRFLNNYYASAERSPRLDREPFKGLFHAVIDVPMWWEGQVIAVLSVSDKNPERVFATYDVEMLERFASRASIALANARLYEKERRQAQIMQTLFEAGQAVTAMLSFEKLTETIFELTRSIIPFRTALLFLWDPKHERLVVRGHYGYERGSWRKFTFKPGDGLTGQVASSREPLLVEDAKKLTGIRLKYDITEPGHPLRSFMGVPLIVGDDLIGVFDLTSDEPGKFTQEDLYLLSRLAGQLAIAIDHSRLFEETTHRAEENTRLARQLTSIVEMSSSKAPRERAASSQSTHQEKAGGKMTNADWFTSEQSEEFHRLFQTAEQAAKSGQADWAEVSKAYKAAIDYLGEACKDSKQPSHFRLAS
jgi:GAF domain-containing protein